MATIEPRNLPDGGPTALGGDGSISLDSELIFQNSDGTTRKISVESLLGFLGINVGTEAEVQAAVTTRSDPMVAMITDGRKVNHVQGRGTFAETASNGTGVLAQLQGTTTDWEALANGEDVVV